jgi:hypothetical protein
MTLAMVTSPDPAAMANAAKADTTTRLMRANSLTASARAQRLAHVDLIRPSPLPLNDKNILVSMFARPTFVGINAPVGTRDRQAQSTLRRSAPRRDQHRTGGASLNSYYGCCGVVAGGVAGGPSVGGEAGRRYQTMINARTTAAAMMSNLFVSIVPPILPRQAYPAFAGRNKLGESLIKPRLVEDHNDAPQNHGYFGPGSPLRRPLIFVGAPDNSDYSGQNVRERH